MSREMKDSGIPWIGEIPKDWQVVYGKKVYLANDGGVWGEDADGIDDTVVLRSTEQDIEGRLIIEEPARRKLTYKEYESAKLKVGDLIITKSSGSPSHIGKTSLITESVAKLNCCYSNFIQRLRVNGNSLFYWFLLNSVVVKKQFEYLSTTTTGINNINSKTLDNLLFPLPSLAEQQRIAEFLDRKCAEVDEMIALQEQIIEELKAYKQSVITEAVTKGLNPDVPMKDSGIEWIGEIPKHYICSKLKYYVKIDSGDAISNEIIRPEGTYPVYGGGEIMGYHSESNTSKDSLVIGRVGARCGCVTMPNTNCWATDNALVLKTEMKLRFMYYLLIGINLNRLNTSNAQPLITATKVKNEHISLPPIEEQQAIADYLDEKCADIDSLIQTKQSKIDSLKEYKKSIIYEYVTGKREVE